MLNQAEIMDLENLLDHYSLSDILESLAQIANEKADHLRTNWQDENTAKIWERDANKLSKLASKLES